LEDFIPLKPLFVPTTLRLPINVDKMKRKGCDVMLRLLKLELKKLSKTTLLTIAILTVLTCILTCTMYQEYSIYFKLDAWEIGTEYIGLFFPLFVTVPVCWELYYERRNRFLVYTLPRISKRAYLGAKWLACSISAFMILFIPYMASALCALYINTPNIKPLQPYYDHIWYTLYTQLPLLYTLLLAFWKGMLGVLTMSFGFALALYGKNIFVVLTAPFIYAVLENFILAILNFPMYRFVTAFEPTSIAEPYINVGSFLAGPTLMCLVIALVILYFKKVKKSSVYTI
jgi:hypothetical protein